MDELLTFNVWQATALAGMFFLAGAGASHIGHAILRAAWTAPYLEAYPAAYTEPAPAIAPEPEVIVVEAPPRNTASVLPARQRFITPIALTEVSPAEWARRSFADPSQVRLSVHIARGVCAVKP